MPALWQDPDMALLARRGSLDSSLLGLERPALATSSSVQLIHTTGPRQRAIRAQARRTMLAEHLSEPTSLSQRIRKAPACGPPRTLPRAHAPRPALAPRAHAQRPSRVCRAAKAAAGAVLGSVATAAVVGAVGVTALAYGTAPRPAPPRARTRPRRRRRQPRASVGAPKVDNQKLTGVTVLPAKTLAGAVASSAGRAEPGAERARARSAEWVERHSLGTQTAPELGRFTEHCAEGGGGARFAGPAAGGAAEHLHDPLARAAPLRQRWGHGVSLAEAHNLDGVSLAEAHSLDDQETVVAHHPAAQAPWPGAGGPLSAGARTLGGSVDGWAGRGESGWAALAQRELEPLEPFAPAEPTYASSYSYHASAGDAGESAGARWAPLDRGGGARGAAWGMGGAGRAGDDAGLGGFTGRHGPPGGLLGQGAGGEQWWGGGQMC